jgi:hypothetical protein
LAKRLVPRASKQVCIGDGNWRRQTVSAGDVYFATQASNTESKCSLVSDILFGRNCCQHFIVFNLTMTYKTQVVQTIVKQRQT